jgi:anti-sigma factor RsiW
MICQTYDEQIGDYVDGTLPFTEVARLEAHLADCSRCRAVAADFRSIRLMARSLEPQVPPPHVWRNLSAAVRPSGGWPSFRAFLFTWQPAAATAMAMALSVGLWWIGHRLSAVAPTSSGRAAVTASQDSASAGSAPLAAEVHYTSAIASLEEITSSERAALDPEMIDVLDTGMTIIDTAIDQSRAALETNPDSEAAQESLFQALRSKVALLQDTLSLVNEMRKDGTNPEMTP